MAAEDPITIAKDSASIVGEIIKAAGDSPEAKEAASNLGRTAVTLTKAINNALLPLAAINFACDKAKNYFGSVFQRELSERAAKIPQDSIIEPKASIAGPALQGLAFTHEEPLLKNLYLGLLATAMDGRVANSAHPAFVEIIKQLDGEDADLIRGALRCKDPIAIAEIRLTDKEEQDFTILTTHLLNLQTGAGRTTTPVENERLPALVDNWGRLGLVQVSYERQLSATNAYAWIEQRPELARFRQQYAASEGIVTYRKGALWRTHLGERFAYAVGLNDLGQEGSLTSHMSIGAPAQ